MKKLKVPIKFQLLSVVLVAAFTVIYGFGVYRDITFFKGGAFVGNLRLIICLCNISFNKIQ